MRLNVFAKTKKFAKPLLSVHMGPRSNFLSKTMVKILLTLSLLVYFISEDGRRIQINRFFKERKEEIKKGRNKERKK